MYNTERLGARVESWGTPALTGSTTNLSKLLTLKKTDYLGNL